MSTALQKFIERKFFKWFKEKGSIRVTLWQAYLQGYQDGISHAQKIMKEGISEDNS